MCSWEEQQAGEVSDADSVARALVRVGGLGSFGAKREKSNVRPIPSLLDHPYPLIGPSARELDRFPSRARVPGR